MGVFSSFKSVARSSSDTVMGMACGLAMAVSSGAEGLEAVALSSTEDPSDDDLAVAADLPGQGVVLWHADPRGQLRRKVDVRART